MAMEPFKLGRDFNRIRWLPTIQVNLLRSVAAGSVVGLAILIGSLFDERPGAEWTALATPLLWPLMWLVGLLPIGIVCALLAGWLDNIVGTIAAFVALIMALYQTIGDPLIFVLHRVKPEWVPLDRYPFFGFTLILWVLRPQVVTAATFSE